MMEFFKWLLGLLSNLPKSKKEKAPDIRTIAWGEKVSQTFRDRIVWIADDLNINVNYLMACIAFESMYTFSANILNKAGSGAVGLIQFMPATAVGLGTTSQALAKMTPEEQLNFVYKYFKPYKGRINTVSDLYMSILWPAAIGKSEDYVLWTKATRPTTYRQNIGLDLDKNENITKSEAATHVKQALNLGFSAENVWTGEVFPNG